MATQVPADLKYSKEHEWVRMEDKTTAVIGITDHAQSQLGDIVFVELPKMGAEAKCMKSLGVVESVKAASEVYAPVAGEVVAVNGTLTDEPAKVNESPEVSGWSLLSTLPSLLVSKYGPPAPKKA